MIYSYSYSYCPKVKIHVTKFNNGSSQFDLITYIKWNKDVRHGINANVLFLIKKAGREYIISNIKSLIVSLVCRYHKALYKEKFFPLTNLFCLRLWQGVFSVQRQIMPAFQQGLTFVCKHFIESQSFRQLITPWTFNSQFCKTWSCVPTMHRALEVVEH